MLRIMRTCTVCGEQFEHEQRAGRPPTTCGKASCRRVRKTRQTEESRTRMSEKDCPPAKHGTATGYTQYKCRCPRCTNWAKLYKQGRRAKKARQP